MLHGRDEIGRTDPMLLCDKVDGPRLLLLGGRSWRVTWTDWKRRRCFVERADGGGRARWLSDGTGGRSHEVTRAMRDVLLGSDVPVPLTKRASGMLAGLRSDAVGRVWAGGSVISRSDADLRRLCLPAVDEKALAGLKFAEALPRPLAEATPAARLADLPHAKLLLAENHRFAATTP